MSASLLMISRGLFTLVSEQEGQNIPLEVFRGMLFPFPILWWCSTCIMIWNTNGHKFQPICFLLFTSPLYAPPSFYHLMIEEEFHHTDVVLTTMDFYSVVITENGLEVSWISYVTFTNLLILMHVFIILIVTTAENTKR